jgi:hypothetical protein
VVCCISGTRSLPKGGRAARKFVYTPFKAIYTEQCSILGCNAVFTDRPRTQRIEEHMKN